MPNTTYVGIKTLLRKEINRILRIWTQTLLPPAITMTLYFIIFGNLIGSRIGNMDGFDYMSFIVPGLVMMAVITSSYGNMVSSFFGAKFAKHVEELASHHTLMTAADKVMRDQHDAIQKLTAQLVQLHIQMAQFEAALSRGQHEPAARAAPTASSQPSVFNIGSDCQSPLSAPAFGGTEQGGFIHRSVPPTPTSWGGTCTT